MYHIYQIGTISFDSKESKRAMKALGGISGYTLELINYLLIQGFDISFIGKIYNYTNKRNLVYYEIKKNVTKTSHFLFHLFLNSIFIRTRKRAIIHAHRPDHLAAFMFFRKGKSVITLHGQQTTTVNMRNGKVSRTLYHFFEKYALNKANALIAVDNVTKKVYSSKYPSITHKLVTIPTGVNINQFFPKDKNEVRKKYGYSVNEKLIVYVGRLEPPKRLDIIIKAFKILTERSYRYKLIIVGNGALLPETQAQVNKSELNSNVTFVGVRMRHEISPFYNMADISVLYSDNEGSPLSVKESLACGVPVVANSVGDIPSLIKDGFNGYVIKKEGIEDLAAKMELAIENCNEMKQNCVSSIGDYTTDIVNRRVVDLYNKILNA